MPSATVTVTADAGPGKTITSGVFTSVSDVNFQLGNNTFSLTASDGSIKTFDWNGIDTVTFTVSAGNGTVIVS